MLQPSAASTCWAAEAALDLQGVALHSLSPLEQQNLLVRTEVQRELHAAGLGGVAGAWGGRPSDPPVPPRCTTLEELVQEVRQLWVC